MLTTEQVESLLTDLREMRDAHHKASETDSCQSNRHLAVAGTLADCICCINQKLAENNTEQSK